MASLEASHHPLCNHRLLPHGSESASEFLCSKLLSILVFYCLEGKLRVIDSAYMSLLLVSGKWLEQVYTISKTRQLLLDEARQAAIR